MTRRTTAEAEAAIARDLGTTPEELREAIERRERPTGLLDALRAMVAAHPKHAFRVGAPGSDARAAQDHEERAYDEARAAITVAERTEVIPDSGNHGMGPDQPAVIIGQGEHRRTWPDVCPECHGMGTLRIADDDRYLFEPCPSCADTHADRKRAKIILAVLERIGVIPPTMTRRELAWELARSVGDVR